MNAPLKEPRAGLDARLRNLDWPAIGSGLLTRGFATTAQIVSEADCAVLRDFYDQDGGWRNHIHMARHGFGSGEYKYFAYPLPEIVAMLRRALYPPLSDIANAWSERLGRTERFPVDHSEFLARCHSAEQRRPTPLMLRYRAGDYNCLHRDIYGDIYFPFQAAILLSAPRRDFAGGEFVLVENRPRMQSRTHVVPLEIGQMVMFAVNERPQEGRRGTYRVTLRHGVSEITAGERHALGVIFHDALGHD